MHVERLQRLIKVMEAVRDSNKKFYIGSWAEVNTEHPTLCGTSACAAGWCAFDPQFIADGFYMEASWRDEHDGRHTVNISLRDGWDRVLTALADEDFVCDVLLTPTFNGECGFAATEAYFELDEVQNSYLFDGTYYSMRHTPTPDDVITHVRAVLDGSCEQDEKVQLFRAECSSNSTSDFE